MSLELHFIPAKNLRLLEAEMKRAAVTCGDVHADFTSIKRNTCYQYAALRVPCFSGVIVSLCIMCDPLRFSVQCRLREGAIRNAARK